MHHDIIHTDVLLLPHTLIYSMPTVYFDALKLFVQAYHYSVLQLKAWLTTFLVVNYANVQLVIWQPIEKPAHIFILKEGFLTACQVAAVYTQLQTEDWSTVKQTVDDALCPTPWAFLSGWPCHSPSIMARRSSPLLLELGDCSPDSVNSPMILASSALTCWSWKTMLSTNQSARVVITKTYAPLQ